MTGKQELAGQHRLVESKEPLCIFLGMSPFVQPRGTILLMESQSQDIQSVGYVKESTVR